MAILDKHKVLETNATLLLVFSFLVVTIGGLVQIVPLFYLENTIEEVEGMRPYTPLELAGRDVYLREGCYVCHSQMIRQNFNRTINLLLKHFLSFLNCRGNLMKPLGYINVQCVFTSKLLDFNMKRYPRFLETWQS